MNKAEDAARPLIACVDDEASVLEALEGLLRAYGYRVRTYGSAEEFLQSSELRSIACLITDVHLGGQSGLQLQDALTAMGHAIPTIIITAFGEDGYRATAVKAGAVDFLTKPISPTRFLAAVRSALGQHDPERD